MEKDPRIDAYIEKSQDFAKPILNYIRETVHETCPEVQEDWKWSYPHFMYKGKILAAMCAFKKHCGFGFWLEKEMQTLKKYTENREKPGMFTMNHITAVEDLPEKAKLQTIIREAMELTDKGVTQKKAPPSKTEVEIPEDFSAELAKNPAAKAVFEKASPSFRKEYILWITDAKTETTRNKRLQQALEWITEGKGRNWKYEKC